MTEIRVTDLYSEPYGSTGNLGDNFLRLLGAPSIDNFQTVIRESVQNIADAALPGKGPGILVRLRALTKSQHEFLKQSVLAQVPECEASRIDIARSLSRNVLNVLEICDFNTTGLTGPTRADRIPIGTKATQFLDFLRNIGTAPEIEGGGGTYGFGKAALYRSSCCSTILVDTLPHEGAGEERRFMVSHVGESYSKPSSGMEHKFTGRHWWGVRHEDGVVEPVTGVDAESIASALGMPEREDARKQSGTSIMILDMDLQDSCVDDVGNRICEALLWNFWPRLMNDTPEESRFNLRVEINGVEINVPEPERFPPLELYCKAMRAIRNRSDSVKSIECLRPRKFLGSLAIEKGFRAKRVYPSHEDSVIPETSFHIALMRPVQLVVKYLQSHALPSDGMEWAGVFVVGDELEVESAFAESEPPAHDDWAPQSLPKGSRRTYVNVALRRLREHGLKVASIGGVPGPSGHSGPSLAEAAGAMGAVLDRGSPIVGGPGPRPPSSSGTGRRRKSKRATASTPKFVRLCEVDGRKAAEFALEVKQDAENSGE